MKFSELLKQRIQEQAAKAENVVAAVEQIEESSVSLVVSLSNEKITTKPVGDTTREQATQILTDALLSIVRDSDDGLLESTIAAFQRALTNRISAIEETVDPIQEVE